MEECPICSGPLKEAKVAVEIAGVALGSFDGLRCGKCGEEFLLPKAVDEAHELALAKSLFGVLGKPEPAQRRALCKLDLIDVLVECPSVTSSANVVSKESMLAMDVEGTYRVSNIYGPSVARVSVREHSPSV